MRSRFSADLICVVAAVVRDDAGHEGAVLDVFIIAGDMDGVLSGFCGPVGDVARAIVLVLTLDLGLGRPLDGETCRHTGQVRLACVAPFGSNLAFLLFWGAEENVKDNRRLTQNAHICTH